MTDASTKSSVRNWRDWVGLVARLVVGVVLLVAGAIKVTDVPGMQVSLNAYALFPYSVVQVLSYVVPIGEIVLGILLIVGLFTRLSAIASAVLFVAFIAAIASAWVRGISIDCGCFGTGGVVEPEQTRYLEEIIRDAGLLALSLWLSVRPRSIASLDRWLFAINIPEIPYDEESDDEQPAS